jgi:hypothetical protein
MEQLPVNWSTLVAFSSIPFPPAWILFYFYMSDLDQKLEGWGHGGEKRTDATNRIDCARKGKDSCRPN